MKQKPLLKCECCGGMGKRPMSDDLHETLEAVIHLKSAHAAQVVEALGYSCALTAMNNRLAELARLGFLTRTKQGKFWLYEDNDQG